MRHSKRPQDEISEPRFSIGVLQAPEARADRWASVTVVEGLATHEGAELALSVAAGNAAAQ